MSYKLTAFFVLFCFVAAEAANAHKKALSSSVHPTTRKAGASNAKKAGVSKTPGKTAARRQAATTASRRRGMKAAPQALARARRPSYAQQAPTQERYTEIQQALAAKGYYSGPVNGMWGAESTAALKKFQQDQNLTPDGKLGALSIIALGLGPKRQPGGDLASKPLPPQ